MTAKVSGFGSRPSQAPIRYPGWVNGENRRVEILCGASRRVVLHQGDVVRFSAPSGHVDAVIAIIDVEGNSALELAGLRSSIVDRLAKHARATDVAEIDGWLKSVGLDFNQLSFAQLFATDEDDTYAAMAQEIVCRISAPCTAFILNAMSPSAILSGGGGDLHLDITNSAVTPTVLPEPIGQVVDEFTVSRATAQAYELKKGQYVQVIDVQGQQCSDFMAMRTDALDKGRERYIDSAVTRTLVGGAYPSPGLFNKFYDQDMQPLLELTRDTVGRHDTFALACTERGYEERGFPGHVNCSDNISAVYDPYGIQSRKAWPAINFFFNSWIHPTDNRLNSDEAWSRPGDHVVMQALTDLVCVSTACPDDIDPINGWNPTDVHVRIYSANNQFKRAVAHRPYPTSEPVMTEESAFHSRTSSRTSSYVATGSVWAPSSYESTRVLDEYWACREGVTIQDMSSLRKFDIQGPDAEALLQMAVTRDISRLSPNRAVYALLLSDSGSVIDDGTLFRMGPGLFRWCCGSDDSALQLNHIAAKHGHRAVVKPFSTAMPSLAIQGPKSRELLSRCVYTQVHQPALENIKWFGFTFGRLYERDGAPFMLSRTGFTGELGYEIFCHEQHAEAIWDAVMQEGEPLGIVPMGLDALEIIRVEAGLMASGAEFTADVDAAEAGLTFAVDTRKSSFIGREAFIRNSQAVRRKLVGLVIEGNETPSHADPVFDEHVQVGQVTSAVRSPSLQCDIAMARLNIEHSEPGTKLEIGRLDGRMKRLEVTVTEIPFIDPKRTRARA